MTIVIWLVSIFVYVLVGGIVGTSARKELGRRDGNCNFRHGYLSICGTCSAVCGHKVGSISAGVLWPLTIPLFLGIAVAEHADYKQMRTERRRQEELAEAKHQRQLQEQHAAEAEALDRQLKAVSHP